jgi:hypothetical protein
MAVSSQAATANDIDSDRIEFVIGNVVFVTLHEFSHLIIEDFDIPVLGNGEDAADTLAAISLIHMDRAHPERDFPFIAMLLSAADANAIIYRVDSQANTKVPFFDTARLREVLTPILGHEPPPIAAPDKRASLSWGVHPHNYYNSHPNHWLAGLTTMN